MRLDRRQMGLIALGAVATVSAPAFGSGAETMALAARIEGFRKAQVAADANAFEQLCAAELSYSHSDGRVEDKAQFISNATAGKNKFNALDYKDLKMKIVGDVAVVRFNWQAEQEAIADGKKTATNLHILMNWIKQGGEWRLLSRGSTKL